MSDLLFKIPENCPTCGVKVVEDGDFLYCRNKSCPSQIKGSIQVWIRNLGLLNWGDSLIDNLTNSESLSIQSISDLYKLSVSDIAGCCSGEKVAEKCYSVLHANKDITIELMLGSLNIPNFALSTSTDIVHAGFDTIDKVINMTFDQLLSVPNIGEKTARSILFGIIDKVEEIKEINKVINIKSPTVGSLTGKSFCITGELSRPRKAMEKGILDAGGLVKSSVGKTTSYLVTNDPTTGSSKLQKAAKYGVSVIDENTLCSMINIDE